MATNGTGPDRTALVLYGTETGTAQDVAEEASLILERLYFSADVIGLDGVSTVGPKRGIRDVLGSLLSRLTFHHTHYASLLSPRLVKETSHPMRGTFGQVC